MKHSSFLIVIVSLLLLFITFPKSFADNSIIQPGEELLYEVSFFGVKLGSIKIITEENQVINDMPVHKCKAFIDSYNGIPFVDLHTVFETWMDTSASYSHKFVGNIKEKEGWVYQQALFDYDNKKISQESWRNKSKYLSKTFLTQKKFNDGLSLFFMARKYVHSKRNLKIPTLLEVDTVTTSIYFSGEKESVSIDAINYPVKTVHFTGKADWTGIYGLSGKFEGWFSDDTECIPIKAKMNVYVGSVVLELKSWKRNYWKPPKG